jgi:hypothetical protein
VQSWRAGNGERCHDSAGKYGWGGGRSSESLLNNHVLAAVLHLNERVDRLWSTTSPRCGMSVALLDWMKEYNMSPVTVHRCCRVCRPGGQAGELLRDMQQQMSRYRPQVHVMHPINLHSAAISACARPLWEYRLGATRGIATTTTWNPTRLFTMLYCRL